MPGPTLPLDVSPGDVRAYERTAADLGLMPRPLPSDVPRFTEADRIAHAIIVAGILAFVVGVVLGRLGFPG